MFEGFFGFPSREDGFLVVSVAVFALLAGAGVVMAWLNRRKE
ncbi:hypothetical protein N0B44_19445 [Roseibacterium beibuensis]|nr:hypothetical protein [Roseibacterium beibuensis]MCS6625092.1 hypothetical protein [Roseibacterium beibuensis]